MIVVGLLMAAIFDGRLPSGLRTLPALGVLLIAMAGLPWRPLTACWAGCVLRAIAHLPSLSTRRRKSTRSGIGGSTADRLVPVLKDRLEKTRRFGTSVALGKGGKPVPFFFRGKVL